MPKTPRRQGGRRLHADAVRCGGADFLAEYYNEQIRLAVTGKRRAQRLLTAPKIKNPAMPTTSRGMQDAPYCGAAPADAPTIRKCGNLGAARAFAGHTAFCGGPNNPRMRQLPQFAKMQPGVAALRFFRNYGKPRHAACGAARNKNENTPRHRSDPEQFRGVLRMRPDPLIIFGTRGSDPYGIKRTARR